MSDSDNLYEEDQNIDDLVDYNDFDSKDLDSKDDMDSFNNDILKFYEDHKKNVNAKGNEVNNAQRPISSYHRVVLTDNNKKENSELTKKRDDDEMGQFEKTDREDELCDEKILENLEEKDENLKIMQGEQDEEEINYNDFNDDIENSNLSKTGNKKILEHNDKSGIKSENKNELVEKSKSITPNKSQQQSVDIRKNSTPHKISENLAKNPESDKIIFPQPVNLIPPITSESFIIEYSLQDFEQIKLRLNNYLKSHSITKSQFCDNTNLFLSFDDFFDLFKKIKFDLTKNEAKILFNHLNPNKNEGYIMIKHFYSYHGLEYKELTFENTTEGYDLDRLNQQFKTLHSEILDVIKKDLFDQSNQRMGLKTAKYRPTGKVPGSANNKKYNLPESSNKRNIISAVSNALSSGENQINSTGLENMTRSHDIFDGSENINNNSASLRSFNRPMSGSKLILSSIKNSSYLENPQSKPKLDVKDLLKARIKKEKEEDLLMRQNFEKRQNEFIKDCIKKMEEANRICVELGLQKSYNTYTEDVSVI
jgi:hypothetical protein